jgi:bifunctional non-homologous end joining protein LigD
MPGSSNGADRVHAPTVDIDGRRLTLSNLDKVLFPATGFRKGDVVDYYVRIAPALLPHLRDRVLTMVRWPDGVDGPSFFEKRCPPHAPDWVRRARADHGVDACVVDDVATLVWVANLAALELHTHQATAADPDHPQAVVFDLDPGPPATVAECCRVALDLRSGLEALGLTPVVKTSGSKGLHVAAAVTGADAAATKAFALAFGQLLARRTPDRVTVVMARDQRAGKVFVDWSQNDRMKTTVTAYSLRARSRPGVSTPLTWDEVAAAAEADGPDLDFTPDQVVERVGRLGDLYAAGLGPGVALPTLA